MTSIRHLSGCLVAWAVLQATVWVITGHLAQNRVFDGSGTADCADTGAHNSSPIEDGQVSLNPQLFVSMFVTRPLPPSLLLLVLVQISSTTSTNDIDDITSERTFRSPNQPLISYRDKVVPKIDNTHSYGAVRERPRKVKNRNILHQYFGNKKENLGANTSSGAYLTRPTEAPSSSWGEGYGKPKRGSLKTETSSSSWSGAYGKPRETSANHKPLKDPTENRQVVAGIPDTNDPCFRRYANCIIVNAQPYERRSSMSLVHCKSHCLHSQTGVYSCRSFVYDNINQVCDLYPHVGDQAPARLLKFQTRDYYEPTHALQCLDLIESTTTTTSTTTSPTTTEYVTESTTEQAPVIRATKLDRREESSDIVKALPEDLNEQSRPDVPESVTMRCPAGKKISFLRTEGFELFNNDDMTMHVSDVSECVIACEKNNIDGQALDCRSFDFSLPTCSFSSETAVPVGNGQLQQRNDSFYYEKICVSESSTRNCSPTFTRFPQMVLVGFAEAVADTSSFEACFELCLDSFSTFGFNCTSGMYFFEEAQLNCILNSESRHTQKDLFAEENTDIVDYFEIGCEKPQRRRIHAARTHTLPEKLVIAAETQTEWSECEDGLQHRRRDCNNRENCGLESRPCEGEIKSSLVLQDSPEELPTHEDIAKVKAEVRKHGLRCAPDVCCNVFNKCSVGLRLNSKMKRLEWCKRPCADKGRKRT